MWNSHFSENVDSELLEAADVDGPLLCGREVAGADTEVARGADHPTCQSQRIVTQDRSSGSVVVLIYSHFSNAETR